MKNKTQSFQSSTLLFNGLFLLLLSLSAHANDDLLAHAKKSFEKGQLDAAESSIEKALKIHSNDVDVLFLAGRIAGKKAQKANIFSKLGHARDSKKYFTKALEINPKHQPSLIGLIRFHQQAPVMAGGDKESAFELMELLRSIDARAAFSIEAPLMLERGDLKATLALYSTAMETKGSHTNKNQFQFDSAMLFSAYGHYHKALEEMLAISMQDQQSLVFANMRLYQLGKLTAETQSQLQLGLQSMRQYALLPASEKTIPDDWVEFRLAQLQFLIDPSSVASEIFLKLQAATKDSSLKEKIRSFLEQRKA